MTNKPGLGSSCGNWGQEHGCPSGKRIGPFLIALVRDILKPLQIQEIRSSPCNKGAPASPVNRVPPLFAPMLSSFSPSLCLLFIITGCSHKKPLAPPPGLPAPTLIIFIVAVSVSLSECSVKTVCVCLHFWISSFSFPNKQIKTCIARILETGLHGSDGVDWRAAISYSPP